MAAIQAPNTQDASTDPLPDRQPPNITIRPEHDARSISWENIPSWKKHYWTRVSKEVVTKLPSAAVSVSEAPVSPISEIMADSDGESSSESDEGVDDPLSGNTTAEKPKRPRFPMNAVLNEKISLWMGDPTVLNVEAVVNPTPITSSDKKGLGVRILEVAGPELAKHLSALERPKTGEVRPSSGYNIVAPTILHTIGPRYSDHYITAAENALHNCYRSALDYCLEHHISTLAIPPIHSLHRQFPTLLGAHIAIRTLRCIMDVRPTALRRLVLCFDPADNENLDTYYALMKLYFPRTEQEEAAAIDQLPEFNGNEFGETIMEERQVRIQATFMDERNSRGEKATGHSHGEGEGNISSSSWSSAASQSDDTFAKKDKDSFPSSMRSMSAYKDDERRKQFGTPASASNLAFEDLYSQYLALANTTDLSLVSQLGMFYQAGTDRHGRPLIVIVGCRIPNDHKLHDLVFLNYIKFMDHFADSPYVLLYIHTNVSSKKKPPIAWFKKVYSIMDGKYSRSLVALHVLHPTFWLKVVEKLVSVFMSADSIIDKITYHERLVDLCLQLRLVPRLPNDILQFDTAENGPLPPNLEDSFK